MAEPRAVDATVVWASDTRAYVTTSDSSGLAVGLLVTFVERERSVAWGEVTDVLHGEMAVVRLWSGALHPERLDRLAVMVENPLSRRRRMLRAGIPSPRRAHALVDCRGAPGAESVPAGYAADSAGGAGVFLRADTAATGSWPDTLVVRAFDDATDQEIALERGELDVAVFWPGERSEHLLEDPRWRDALLARRAHGVVVGSWAAPPRDTTRAALDRTALVALNAELFDGDLDPLFVAADSAAEKPARIVVDASTPGHRALQRFLDRRTAARSGAPVLRMKVLDVAIDSPAGGPLLPPGVVPLFRIRCAVVADPALRSYVAALGVDAFAALIPCGRRSER